MVEFEESAFESIVDKIVVKNQNELEFPIGGLELAEKYDLGVLYTKLQGIYVGIDTGFCKALWYHCRLKGVSLCLKTE